MATDLLWHTPTTHDARLAMMHRQATQQQFTQGLLFLHGFASDMNGSKAQAIDEYAALVGCAFTRFDYRGHGQSSGDFTACGIDDWLADAESVLLSATQPQVIIGSSLGGWLGLLLAQKYPQKVAAFVGLAAAPDFTQDLLWNLWSDEEKDQLNTQGFVPYYLDDGTARPFTQKLITSGAQHLVLTQEINYNGSVRLLQGMGDTEVPWQTALDIAHAVTSQDVRVHLIKYSDHRLSQPDDLYLLSQVLDEVLDI